MFSRKTKTIAPVDAALVRLLLVPVLLRLLGRWAWYLPKPLDRLLPDVRFGHA